jgi:hypothetical protein
MSVHCVQVITKTKHNDNPQTHPELNSFVETIFKNGYQNLVLNFNTKEIAVSFRSSSVIGTVNEKEHDNSPLCSPYNLFCLYPKKKLSHIKPLWLRPLLDFSTTILSLVLAPTKFDKVIQLNNKPCDAITYPDLSFDEVEQCIKELPKKFPKHAILFPRIDKITSPSLVKHLELLGFLMVPTRGVHIFLPDASYLKRNHTKKDFGLLKKGEYQLVLHEEINSEDLTRIHQLYTMLFIEKHGKDSPALTPEYIQKCHSNQWYTFFALKNPAGIIDAFFSYETEGNIMACGPLGYDTTQNQEKGLYRMIFAHSLEVAHDNNYIFNFGGGNDEFKMNRGSSREIGYTAVYCRHLPFYRRFPWMLLENLGRRFTVKIIQKVTI